MKNKTINLKQYDFENCIKWLAKNSIIEKMYLENLIEYSYISKYTLNNMKRKQLNLDKFIELGFYPTHQKEYVYQIDVYNEYMLEQCATKEIKDKWSSELEILGIRI